MIYQQCKRYRNKIACEKFIAKSSLIEQGNAVKKLTSRKKNEKDLVDISTFLALFTVCQNVVRNNWVH